MTTQLQEIINFYTYVKSQFHKSPCKYNIVSNDALISKKLSSILLTSEREVYHIMKLAKTLKVFENQNVIAETKVKFKEDGKAFFEFLSCFEFGTSKFINLRKDVKEEKLYEICKYFFIIPNNTKYLN